MDGSPRSARRPPRPDGFRVRRADPKAVGPHREAPPARVAALPSVTAATDHQSRGRGIPDSSAHVPTRPACGHPRRLHHRVGAPAHRGRRHPSSPRSSSGKAVQPTARVHRYRLVLGRPGPCPAGCRQRTPSYRSSLPPDGPPADGRQVGSARSSTAVSRTPAGPAHQVRRAARGKGCCGIFARPLPAWPTSPVTRRHCAGSPGSTGRAWP